MQKLILGYLIGIIIAVNFNIDRYFILIILIMSFIVSFIYFNYNKSHIKQGVITKNIKVIMSFIFFALIVVISILYSKKELNSVSYKNLGEEIYDIEGKIVEVKQVGIGKQIVLRVESATNLSTGSIEEDFPKYIDANVSMFNNYELYDRVSITGVAEFQNWQNYYEKRPLFWSYEFETLLHNTSYNVSYPKKTAQLEYKKTFYEKMLLRLSNLSETLKSRVTDHMQEPYAGVAQGISLGEQDNILKDIKDTFRTSGLIHILVLSGANISFIISLLWYLLRNTKTKIKVPASIFVSWLFIFMTGLTPPAVRAGVMSSSNILSEYLGKNITPIYSLLLSLFILTLLNPLSLIYSPSLHLSFLACFGLFIIAPKLEVFFKKYIKYNFISFLVSTFIGIFLTTTPYILALTGKSSIVGTLLTFFVEPFVMATTILSFLIILASFISSYLADFLGILNSLSVKVILATSDFGATYFPLLNLHIPKTVLIIYYIVLGYIFLRNDIIRKDESSN